MMESKNVFSSISFQIKIENNQIVSFIGQRITFRLSIKEIQIGVHSKLYECLYNSILKTTKVFIHAFKNVFMFVQL